MFCIRLVIAAVIARVIWGIVRDCARPHVLRIIYIGQDAPHRVILLYQRGLRGSFQDAFRDTIRRTVYLDMERGYLLFYIWNPWVRGHQQAICLSGIYAQFVLGITTPYSLWALSDIGVVYCLHLFIMAMGRAPGLVRVIINDMDVSRTMRPLLGSICLAKNLSADAAGILYHITAETTPSSVPSPPYRVRIIRDDLVQIDSEGSGHVVP